MRKLLHAIAVMMAGIPWLLGYLGFGMALGLVLLADWLWPEADRGNCWSFAGPKWVKRGGYLQVRWADEVRLFGYFRIPHAIWVPFSPADLIVRQTTPRRRERAWWKTFYFPFRVLLREKPRDAKWIDSNPDFEDTKGESGRR